MPTIRDDCRPHSFCYDHRYHLDESRVKQRLAAEKADVANIAFMQDVQSTTELVRIDPAQIGTWHFASGEIAEAACGVASVSHSHIAKRRTATAKERQRVQHLGTFHCQAAVVGSSLQCSFGFRESAPGASENPSLREPA